MADNGIPKEHQRARGDLHDQIGRRIHALDDRAARGFAADAAAHVVPLYHRRYPGDPLPESLIEAARAVVFDQRSTGGMRAVVLSGLKTAERAKVDLDAVREAFARMGGEENLLHYAKAGAAYLALLAALGACMTTGLDAALATSERAAQARGGAVLTVLHQGEQAYLIDYLAVLDEYAWQLARLRRC